MAGCTSKHACSPTTLSEIVYCAVHHSEPPAKAIADFLGCRTGYLLDSANPDRAEVQFQLRLFVPLLRFTGRTDLFEAFATLAGFVAFQPPTGQPSIDMLRETARTAHEFAALVDESAAALADGDVSPLEARRLTERGRRVMASTACLMATADRAAGIIPMRQERAS